MYFKWLLYLVLIAVGITSALISLSFENKFIIHALLNTVAGFCMAWVLGLWAGITLGREKHYLHQSLQKPNKPMLVLLSIIVGALVITGLILLLLWPIVPTSPILSGLSGVFLGALIWMVLPKRLID